TRDLPHRDNLRRVHLPRNRAFCERFSMSFQTPADYVAQPSWLGGAIASYGRAVGRFAARCSPRQAKLLQPESVSGTQGAGLGWRVRETPTTVAAPVLESNALASLDTAQTRDAKSGQYHDDIRRGG